MKELVEKKVAEMQDIFVAKEGRIIENYEQVVKVCENYEQVVKVCENYEQVVKVCHQFYQ